MRIFLFLLGVALCPLLATAQDKFAPGTYELADGRKGKGQLEYQVSAHPKLVVKDDAADPSSKEARKGHAYSPEEVRSFEIGPDHYVVVPSIKMDSGMPMTVSGTKKNEFAKVLETGRLELLEYRFVYGTMGHFGNPLNSERYFSGVFLLRRQGEEYATMIPVMGKIYGEVVASYFAGRPDLIKQAGTKPGRGMNWPALVRQYNAAP